MIMTQNFLKEISNPYMMDGRSLNYTKVKMEDYSPVTRRWS